LNFFSLGVTAEALRANIGSKSAISLQRGLVDPKFQVEGVAPTNYSTSQKTRLNDLSYGIKIWTDLSSVLSQSRRLTDGQTDRRTDSFLIARPRLHSMQRGKNGAFFTYMVDRNSAFLKQWDRFGLTFQVQSVVPHQTFYMS